MQMLRPIRSWYFGSRLQKLMPHGVHATAVYFAGKIVGLGVMRGEQTASLKVFERILKREGQLQLAADFLLNELDSSRDSRTGERR